MPPRSPGSTHTEPRAIQLANRTKSRLIRANPSRTRLDKWCPRGNAIPHSAIAAIPLPIIPLLIHSQPCFRGICEIGGEKFLFAALRLCVFALKNSY
jgi:hypothetical protein